MALTSPGWGESDLSSRALGLERRAVLERPGVDGVEPEAVDQPRHRADRAAVVQAHFPSARVVKSLNQLGYHELDELGRPAGASDRIAIGAAGEDRVAVRAVMRLVDRLGFDAVDAGPLGNGVALEPGGSPVQVGFTPTR